MQILNPHDGDIATGGLIGVVHAPNADARTGVKGYRRKHVEGGLTPPGEFVLLDRAEPEPKRVHLSYKYGKFTSITEHKPQHFGRVRAVGPDVVDNIKPGDWVVVDIWNKSKSEMLMCHYVNYAGATILRVHIKLIMAKVEDEALVAQLESESRPRIDYSDGKFSVFGRKILMKAEMPPKFSRSGIALPPFVIGNESLTGRILHVGPQANDVFHEQSLAVGDLVILIRRPSGGKMPCSGDDIIWRCNADEVFARFNPDTETWDPLGGFVFVRDTLVFHREHVEEEVMPNGRTRQARFFTDDRQDSSIVIPETLEANLVDENFYEVIAAGGGWGPGHPGGRSGVSKLTVAPGQLVIVTGFTDQYGNLAPDVYDIRLNGEECYALTDFIVEAVFDGGRDEMRKNAGLPPYNEQ